MLARTVERLPVALRHSICERFAPSRPFRLGLQAIHSTHHQPSRPSSSSSSTRWKTRQSNDSYARDAKVAGLKSRAAFKLLEINDKYRLFNRGDTVVDLGYAPGSWSQVAVNRTQPGGRVVGIDVIPAQPPRGVSTLQGDFLSEDIRRELREFVREPGRGRPKAAHEMVRRVDAMEREAENGIAGQAHTQDDGQDSNGDEAEAGDSDGAKKAPTKKAVAAKLLDETEGRVVNVVLSDMMMNTSGMPFRDHAGSMDLCLSALDFCCDTLATGGNFLCKFYQGEEDKAYELRLKKLFEKVHRIKPDSSRKESREAYFVALKRKAGVAKEVVMGSG